MTNLKPTNLSDAVAQLRRLLRPEELENVKRASLEDLARFYFNHGEYVRNLWVHRGGSPLTQRITAAGGTIGDGGEFSLLVLEALWHDLNGLSYDISMSPHYHRILSASGNRQLAEEIWAR